MEAMGLDNQNLLTIQEKVWPASSKFLDTGRENTESSQTEKLWLTQSHKYLFLASLTQLDTTGKIRRLENSK